MTKDKIKWTTDDEGHRHAQVPVCLSEEEHAAYQKLADEKYHGCFGYAVVSIANGKLLLDEAHARLVDLPRKRVWPKILTLNCIAGSCFDQKGSYSVARLIGEDSSRGVIEGNVMCAHYRCEQCGLKFLDEPQINRLSEYLTYTDSSLPHIPIPPSGWLLVKSSVEPAAKKRGENERRYRLKREKPRRRRAPTR